MLFNSLTFLYLFLPVTFAVFWNLKTKDGRYRWLAVTGYFFYSLWNYKFCALMAFSTAISYTAGLGLLRYEQPRLRKILLIVPITIDLALLGFFKYANMAFSTGNQLSSLLHLPLNFPVLHIVLPVGISFYTFHTITYIVDSYKRTIRPTRNFFEFACYVSLFAQLVAGPIVRFREIEGDLKDIGHDDWRSGLNTGWSYFAIGLFKKVLIADTIALIIDPRFALGAERFSTAGAWLCMLGYSYQLYFDFSGYSDMAVGLGHMFGLRLPQNFNSPYKAESIADFWRRWHISLSSFLRDYLYIPLGGGRGSRLQGYRNLMVTMLLGGLWHGANWTFVIWGAYHGMLLSLNRFLGAPRLSFPPGLRRSGTFLLVVVGWVFFRSPTFGSALKVLGAMFSWRGYGVFPGWQALCLMIALAGAVAHFAPNSFELKHQWGRPAVVCFGALFVLCMVVLYGGQQSPFLYFQF